MKRLVASLAISAAFAGLAVAEEGHPLRLETVDFVIEQHDHAVQRCNRGGRRDIRAVIVHLEIDPDGKVVRAAAQGSRSAETQCLSRLSRSLQFPATGVTSHVEYPFLLLPHLRR
jgi:hypothetical protein